MTPIIEIKNIGKRYNIIGRGRGYVALRDIIAESLKHPFKSLNSVRKSVLGQSRNETFWALKDINFSVGKGEVIGVIGANGAGKSTLLKILTGITPPTTGEIKITGTVASLLEVGTGFHPELTGRENIYLNGAILGMPRKEIAKKFDRIVEFSGIEKFLDTPVKRYSSGMYVRLAFSVAAHLEPDILLVDEVLAVGDAEFQKKCLGKMDEVTRTGGRTIIFVSHNMDAISQLCTKTVLIEKGEIIAFDNTEKVISMYLHRGYQNDTDIKLPVTDEEVTLNKFEILQDGKITSSALGEKPCEISVEFSLKGPVESFRVGIFIKNKTGTVITRSYIQDWNAELEKMQAGKYKTKLIVPGRLLMAGAYGVELKIFSFQKKEYFANQQIERTVTVISPKDYNELRSKNGARIGYFLIPNSWDIEKNAYSHD